MKITWTPSEKTLRSLFNSVHVGRWSIAVTFSTELDHTGIPKFRVRMKRICHNEYRLTIGRPNYNEKQFLKRKKKQGLTYRGGTVATMRKSLSLALKPK